MIPVDEDKARADFLRPTLPWGVLDKRCVSARQGGKTILLNKLIEDILDKGGSVIIWHPDGYETRPDFRPLVLPARPVVVEDLALPYEDDQGRT